MRSDQHSEPRFYVEVNGREHDGRRLDIGPDGLLVGRSRTCDVVFRNREVSRRHAYFYHDGGACYVEDLGSKNGMLVNGRMAKKRRLHRGDAVDIGPSRFFLSTVSEPKGPLRWIIPGGGGAARRQAEPERGVLPATDVRSALAVFSLVFGVMAYLHWIFGACAIVLALLAYWEMRAESLPLPGALLAGALTLGIVGAVLNGWFEGVVPWLRGERQAAARAECRTNMVSIRRALQAYGQGHEGALPAGLEVLVAERLLERDELRCPGCGLEDEDGCPYAYFPPDPESPEDPYAVIVSDSSPANHQEEGGWVLRREGSVDWVTAEQLKGLRAAPDRSETSPLPAGAATR